MIKRIVKENLLSPIFSWRSDIWLCFIMEIFAKQILINEIQLVQFVGQNPNIYPMTVYLQWDKRLHERELHQVYCR